MIGYYDYTVILTYSSVISATVGIFLALLGTQHPYLATFCLLFCGLCDAFDGRVARCKKNRSEDMCSFGVQIDSLSDLLAFGILPACIGYSMWENMYAQHGGFQLPGVLILIISCLYVLGALIRLAYFNVTEEQRQKEESGCRKYYQGLPVTSAALIFPTVALLEEILPGNNNWIYYSVMLLTSVLFVGNFKLRKPGFKAILLMVGIGLTEVILFLIIKFFAYA